MLCEMSVCQGRRSCEFCLCFLSDKTSLYAGGVTNISHLSSTTGCVPRFTISFVLFFSGKKASLYAGGDIYDKIDSTGCTKIYEALENCIVEYDKDWRKCQQELKDFRSCCTRNNVPTNENKTRD
eukprot:GHVS01083081.1.p1 GENE.GHVS01083081.1~~GHVS01083081.1.p1  ORF type:complete len:125 (-),score=15.22 GHVS01083081.1:217-591(-)